MGGGFTLETGNVMLGTLSGRWVHPGDCGQVAAGSGSWRWSHYGDCGPLTPDVGFGRWSHSVECGHVQGLKSRRVTPGIEC